MPDTNRVKRNVQKMLNQGASEREIDQYIASEGVTAEQLRGGKPYKAPAQTPADPPEPRQRKNTGWSGIGSGLMGAAQGLTFGFGDEIAAGVQGLIPGGDDYETALRKRRRDFANAQADNPNAYVAGDVGGSVAGALIPGGAAVRGAGLLSRVGRGAALGGAGGALRGAGDGTDAESRASGALRGGATGAALGGGLTGLGSGLRAGGDLTNRGLDNVVGAVSQTVDNLRASPLGRTLQPRGVSGRATRALAPMSDDLVDAGTDYLATKGPLGRRAAGAIGDFYKDQIGGSSGMMGRAAMSTVFPGLLESEAALRGGAMAASGLGRGLEGVTRRNASGANLGSLGSSITDNKTRYSIEDEEVFNAVTGTRWEEVLLEAQERGPQAMRATLFTLKKNPQFREETGLQLGEDQDDFGTFGGFDDSGF